ncbi:hypothetical protein ISS09_05145 [Candidatus Woesearchaeota archaeon]|nr:hypothetical protein [Candidatus Woesearchaeota archaeon]
MHEHPRPHEMPPTPRHRERPGQRPMPHEPTHNELLEGIDLLNDKLDRIEELVRKG